MMIHRTPRPGLVVPLVVTLALALALASGCSSDGPWRDAPDSSSERARFRSSGAATNAMPAPAMSAGAGGLAMDAAVPAQSLGVTAGGEQDIGLVRALIEDGQVPPPGSVSVEGLLSEHSIPAPPVEDPGDAILYPTVGVGEGRFAGDPEPMAIVQIGFGTTLSMDEFQRRPLNAAVVVDRSGSMEGPKMEAMRDALEAFLDRLGPEDRLAVVSFDDEAFLHLASRPVGQGMEGVREGVRRMRADGSTNIEAGLAMGIEQVAGHVDADRYESRVFLFTDAQPNVGETGPESFLGLATEAAELGIHLSAFGIGLDFDRQLVYEMTRVRGANYFFLEDEEKLERVFEDLDLFVTPVAHDVSLVFTPAPGWEIEAVHGAAETGDEGPAAAAIEIPTLFFSRKEGGGAVLVRMRGQRGEAVRSVGELALSFGRPGAEAHEIHVLEAEVSSERMPEGVAKGHALLGVALAIEAAAEAHAAGEDERAVEELDRFLVWYREAATRDEDMLREALLLERLRANLVGARSAPRPDAG